MQERMPNSKGKLEFKFYIPCKISKGIFSNECVVEVPDTEKEVTYGFVDNSHVKTSNQIGNELTDGLVRVHLIEQQKDKCLVQLLTYTCDRISIDADKLNIFI